MGTTSSSEVRTTPTTTTTRSQDRVNVTSSTQHQPRMSYLPPSRPPDVSPHKFDDDAWIPSSEELPSEVVHKTKLQPSSPQLQLSPQSASTDSARTIPATVTTQFQHKTSIEVTSSTDHPTHTTYLPPSRPLDIMPQQELVLSSKEVPSEACAVETNLQSSSQPLQPTPQGTDVDGTGVPGKSAGPLVQRKVLESESISVQSDDEVHEDGDRSNQELSSPSRIQAQPDCPICLYILREPHIVTCCGQSFCRVCIENVKKAKTSCPMCQQLEFTHIPNRGLQRTLEDTKVCCPHKEAGCRWVGKMGSLRQHLNESGKLTPDTCRFAPKECSQCHKQIQRQMFESHQRESCTQRPFKCEYCGEYKSAYEDVVNNHWPVCKCYPVPCPNECGVSPERRHLESHIDEDCPLTVVSCEFYHAGCDVELLRRDVRAHMNENCVKHMSLLAGMTQRQEKYVTELTNKLEQGQKMLDDIRSENEELKSELKRTKQESETLRAERAEVTEEQKAHQEIADLQEEIFTTLKREKQNLEQKREEKVAMLEAGTEQLRQEISALKVASKHNTADILRRESVSKEEIEKMKQVVKELRLEAASKRQAEQKIDELRQVKEELGEMKQKVDELKKKEKEAGILRYEVSQIKQEQEESRIEREMLRQGSDGIKKEIMELAQHSKTRISHIEMKQEHNKFSIELTMPNFSKHKKANTRWSSHPFYTNPHRYKLCLDVYANGFGDCKGTHVSVYARLVQGEFDDHLEWPFQGDIVVQLLNQVDEDKHPHEAAISFSSEIGDEIPSTVASRVTSAEQSESGWGYDDFISQDALGYSQAEVCQYLRDDCLTFRVMRARPLDLIQEITTLKENVEQLQREKRLACELQPYSSLLVDYVDSKGKSISWQDIGIMIDVPSDATPEGNPIVRVQAQCFLPGPDLSVVLPENVQLASPVYRISATSKFSKKVELSIAHFATLESKDDMTFLHSSDRSPPYHFQPVPGGTFIPHGTCGSLWLSKFSKYATGRRKRTASERGEGTPNSATGRRKRTASERAEGTPNSAKRHEGESNYKYAAFFNSPLEESQQHRWYAVFSVSLYHPAFIKNFRSELKATFPDVRFLESVQFVQLSGDIVELLIPSTDAQEQGYTVESDRHCQISYEEIHIPDQFPSVSDLPMYPPRLRLTIECCDSKGPLKNLECKLDVKGTEKPCYFILKMKAPSPEGVFDSSPGMMRWFTKQFSRSSGSLSSTSSISLEESRGPSKSTPTLQELSSSVVARVTPKWHPLGIQLGLDPAFLQTLEITYPRDLQRRCTEMFRQWLMQPELNPSWDTLIQALNSSSVAQRDLAQELSEK